MVNTKLDNPFEEVEFVASSPLFLVKRMFDCPLSKQKVGSKFCFGCPYGKRNLRVYNMPFPSLPNVEVSIECTY